jgi:hypothetical protein
MAASLHWSRCVRVADRYWHTEGWGVVKFKVRILALVAVALLAVPAPAMSSGANTVYLTGTLRLTESDVLSGAQTPDGYSLSTGDAEITLAVTGDARDKAGATVGFTGTKLSDDRVAVAATAIEVLAPASVPAVSANGAGEVTPATATKKVLVIIGYYNDLAGNPVSPAQADAAFTTDPASVKSYFETASRGRMTTTTTVKGPWALNISNCAGGENGAWSNSRSAVTTVAAANGVNLADYDYIVLWTKVPCGVGWIGQAELPGKYAQILVDYSQYPGDEPALATMVATHEMEHNMFLYHSQGLGCFDASNNQVVLTGSNDCLAFSYADQYTTMGSSGASNHALLDAERLRELGWLDASESQTVTSAGTYTIVPTYSALAGSRELRIVAPNPVNTAHGGVWTIELRSTLSGSPFDQFSGSSLPGATGITIRYSENDVSGFGYSYLVDTIANGKLSSGDCKCSFWDAPLQPGGTVTDSQAGITIHLNSVTASGASVTIGSPATPTPSTFHPLTPPVRILDTRSGNGLGGRLLASTPVTFNVAGRAGSGIPANANAVTGNVTVVNQTNPWGIYLGPNPVAYPGTSSMNFDAGQITGNGLTVALSASGTLSATYMANPGNSTDLVLDLTGYFTPDTSGATYHAITPTRLLDTRIGVGLPGKLASNTSATFALAGRAGSGIPAGAVAITGNLTVVNPTNSWVVYLGPVATNTPGTSNINFLKGEIKGNSLTVALASDGSLSTTYVSSDGNTTDLVLDVTGFYTPDASGASFVPINPTRLLDTRYGNGLPGKLSANTPATFNVGGRGVIPPGAAAITGNVTVVYETDSWAIYLGPDPIASPGTSNLNFLRGDIKGNGLTVALGSGGTLSTTYVSHPGNTTDLVLDVTGYFVK